ncbi:MAG: glycosyltransferase family 39 protein [Microcystaceae cyanobacterium]
MSRLTFAWDRSGNQLRHESQWREIGTGLGLFLAGMVLCFINSDFWKINNFDSINLSIFPVSSPLAHWEMAIASFPLNFPWLLLIINGIATALSVPLLYNLGKEVFRFRLPALFSGIIYLTFLPIFIQGRTVSLNGCILLLAILLFTCGLRSRRDLRWSLGVGLSAGILILFNYWVGILFFIALFTFLCWDTPRLITSGYFWLGAILGAVFLLAYYGYFVIEREMLSSLRDFNLEISHFSPLAWLKLLLFSLPWLIFLNDGWKLAWKESQWSWAKFVIVLVSIMGLGAVLSNLFTPFPLWLSIYPIFALIGGMTLSYAYHWPSDRIYPLRWSWFLFSLAVITFIGGLSLYFDLFGNLFQFSNNQDVLLLMSALILTFMVSGILILRRNQQFISILMWGLYVSSILWFKSLHSLVFSFIH